MVSNLDEADSGVEVGLNPSSLFQMLKHVLVSVIQQHVGHEGVALLWKWVVSTDVVAEHLERNQVNSKC